uniref:Prolyl 4-hydroxylase alpha subunit Fe(2+) 2OG dioxygenase domain-containing protein n=1 Tax=viral metagenome TaxID=1070528 RepID=A0A6C0ACY2_9ZZZZ
MINLKISKESKDKHSDTIDRFFSNLYYNFTESMGVNCESMIDNVIAVHENHRRSKHLNLYSELSCPEFTVFLDEHNLVPSPKGWSILRYQKGDFFKPHTDRIGEYTAILYPKFYGSEKIKGGKIIIGSFELSPDEIEDHTILIFKTDLLHEVTEILEGNRYTMKISLFKVETFEIMMNMDKKINNTENIHDLFKSEGRKRHDEIRNSDELWDEYVKIHGKFAKRYLKYGQKD